MNPKISRRIFLKGVGTIFVVSAAGGTWWASERGVFSYGKGIAYDPWRKWQAEGNPKSLRLVNAAILAANPHNTQPWRFHVTESQIEMYADRERNLGAIDPYLREMETGLGCALENLLIAARANGYTYSVTIPDDSSSDLIARVDLSPGAPSATGLYEAIPRRHTNRGYYDTHRPVSAETLKALSDLGGSDARVLWYSEPNERKYVGDLIIQATEAIIADPVQIAASNAWERFDWKSIQAHRDGITLDAQGLSPMMRFLGKIFPTSSDESNRYWLDGTKNRYVGTAAAFGIIVVPDSTKMRHRVNGGRLWQRMHLWGTVQGLAMQPLNQLTERADRERSLGVEPRFGKALDELIHSPDWQALMSFRIGYPKEDALLSPRRSLEQVVF